MYTFEKFIELLIGELKRSLEDVDIDLQVVKKNNGTIFNGLIFRDRFNIAPIVYVDTYYNQFKEGKNIGDISKEIKIIYLNNRAEKDFNISEFMNFEKIKSHIVFELVNYEKNKEQMEDIPHICFLDLAIIFKVYLIECEKENATILIHNSHLDIWECDKSELYELAKKNTPEIYGFDLVNILQQMKDILGVDVECFGELQFDFPMYVLTNCKKLNGASCILYGPMSRFSTN